MLDSILKAGAASALVLFTALPAAAHVSLATPEARAGSTYIAEFGIGHGCEGNPTTTVRVQIPAGVGPSIKPMPKAGWTLTTVIGQFPEPLMDFRGNAITEGVREVIWTGGALPDDWFDQFVIRFGLPDAPGTTLHFPVVQECSAGGEHRWIEVEDGAAAPAPTLMLIEGGE